MPSRLPSSFLQEASISLLASSCSLSHAPNVTHVFPLSSVFHPPFTPHRVPGLVTGGEFLSDPPRVSPPQSKRGADKNRLLCSFHGNCGGLAALVLEHPPGHLISPRLVLGEVVRNSNSAIKTPQQEPHQDPIPCTGLSRVAIHVSSGVFWGTWYNSHAQGLPSLYLVQPSQKDPPLFCTLSVSLSSKNPDFEDSLFC